MAINKKGVSKGTEGETCNPVENLEEPQKRPKKGCCGLSYNNVLMVANCIMVALTTPYIYYSLQVYFYIHEHAEKEAGPEFTFRPDLRDIWISVVSGICIRSIKVLLMNHGQLLIRNICNHKPEDTQEMKDFKVAQTAKRLFPVLYHSFASFGTYWVIKDESWLPWYMGGNGIFIEGFDNGPFTPLKPEIYRWGLILLGYPL